MAWRTNPPFSTCNKRESSLETLGKGGMCIWSVFTWSGGVQCRASQHQAYIKARFYPDEDGWKKGQSNKAKTSTGIS
ncbi:unnamed protein product [Blepharisma stoltei]|uniref:Uncharacterized protein n=1 Tax=Blepharisma stoltei TaxID=1481888 RepID=A0AAU9J8V8_9CILI|nr:unnamed protein product [Blepharisma stoltei]